MFVTTNMYCTVKFAAIVQTVYICVVLQQINEGDGLVSFPSLLELISMSRD